MALASARLRLEPLTSAHADVMIEGLKDGSLYAFMEGSPPQDLASLRERYRMLETRQSPDGQQTWLNWAIWSKDEAAYVGYVQATIEDATAMLGYVVFTKYWGRGYGRGAVADMITLISETHSGIEFRAQVDPRNGRSIGLLESLGFGVIPA